jgi:hypothetical protein
VTTSMNGSPHPLPEAPRASASDDRLGSWKEIAAYLGRDVRTVQRWEQSQGLPVYRHRHSRLSTAYAFKSELDAWWHNRPAVTDESESAAFHEHAQKPSPVAGSTTTNYPYSWPLVTALTLAGMLAIWLGGGWWLGRSPLRATVPFAARDFILVTAFDNRTGESLYDGTVEYALERELSNSSFVNVVPRARIQDTLELMRRPLDTRLDAEIGREVAARDGNVRVLLAGRVERFGTRYVVTADILRTHDGAMAASVREEASTEAEVLDAIGQLAVVVRRRLGESLDAAPAPPQLPKVTTASLRALQLFAQARDAMGWNENTPVDRGAAEQLLRQAIAIDPEFAQAQMTLAEIGASNRLGAHVAMLPHVDRAVAAAAQAPETERLLIEAQAHIFRAAYVFTDDGIAQREARERGIASLEAILRIQPDHFVALQRLLAVTRLSAPMHARAREVSLRYAELRPTSAKAQVDAARLAMEHGDVTTARRHVDRARALGVPLTHYQPDAAVWLALFDANEAWWMGDPRRALTLADTFAANVADLSTELRERAAMPLFFTYLSLGRLQQADEVMGTMPSSVEAWILNQQRGRVMALRGDRKALAAFLSEHFQTAEEARAVASNLMDAGLFPLAREVVAYHRRRQMPVDEWYAGQLALAEGRIDEAIRRLTIASRRVPERSSQGSKIARQLADAHFAAGRLDQAVHLLEDATRHPVEIIHGWEWLRTRNRLSELYRIAGRSDDAEAVDRQLATLLAVADDDHFVKQRVARTAREFGRPGHDAWSR